MGIKGNSLLDLTSEKVTYEAPSNIAIVKYWGKKGVQQPINPSISFTLSKSCTTTTVHYKPKVDTEPFLDGFLFEGIPSAAFEKRVADYLQSVSHLLPILSTHTFFIESTNSFPHSSGIASSASSMAALALCMSHINGMVYGEAGDARLASTLARLGSGSGCRSVKGRWNLWGKTDLIKDSSDEYAVEIENVAPVFNTLCDTILIIDPQKKSVSSSAGHNLMNNHPYKEGRINQAHSHIRDLLLALQNGDLELFIHITESEAFSLHALMMSSSSTFTLLLPNTLEAIRKIQDFRHTSGIPICFTLDAGPNVHLIYPQEFTPFVLPFIENELAPLCNEKRVIFDFIGQGAKQI